MSSGPQKSGEADERVDLPVLDGRFKANPYPLYERFRNQDRSIVPIRLPSGLEAWLVTGYADARRLLKDPGLSKDAAYAKDRRDGPDAVDHPLFHHLLTLDPPDHARLRAIIAREFSTRRVKLLRPCIREAAVALLDKMAPRGAADIVHDFALPLSLTVICRLIGIPAANVALAHEWSARLSAADLDDVAQVPFIAEEIDAYLLGLAREKRARPDDSLYGALVAVHDRGELSDRELTAMGFLLLSAGHETTTSLIANGVLALLREPSAWADLCADSSRAAAAVEEILRLESPLEVATVRYAKTEIPVGRTLIRPGDRVFVGLAAANRDPRHFDKPDELDMLRASLADHMAFGHGIHFCIGATLARAEAEIALAELAQRFPRLALGVPPDALEWTPGLILRGPRALPVRFPADAA